MKYLFSFSVAVHAQEVNKTDFNKRPKDKDTLVIDFGKRFTKICKPTINHYVNQKQFSEKIFFDTVLTFNKTYIFSQYNNNHNKANCKYWRRAYPLTYEFNPPCWRERPLVSATVKK